jgi:hypothetical protein
MKCKKCGKEVKDKIEYEVYNEMHSFCWNKELDRKLKRNITIIILIGIVGMVLAFGNLLIKNIIEKNIFNKLHNTNYSLSDWIFAKNTILDYTEGKVLNLNLKQK